MASAPSKSLDLTPDLRKEISAEKSNLFHLGILVLRMVPLVVLLTWGWMKLSGFWSNTVLPGKPLSSSGWVAFIARLGLPFPALLAVCAIVNETFASAAMTLGLITRGAATFATLGMCGALYASWKLGEGPLAASICLVSYASLIALGAGKYSVDYCIPAKWEVPAKSADLGVLVLRVGREATLIETVVSSLDCIQHYSDHP